MAEETKRDYYEVLGVPRDASVDDLRAAYRGLARQYHPDVSKEPNAEAVFKEVNEAYQILSNEEQRAAYDHYGHAGVNRAGMGQGFEGFGFGGIEDIFEGFFGFGGRRSSRPGPRRGADLRYDIEIEFEEAVFGCEKEIQIGRMETCSHCGGSGAEPGTSPIRCPDCGGSGQIRRAQQSIFGSFVNVTTCSRCQGTGEAITTPCTRCHGSQRTEEIRRIAVAIPAGVDDGMRVRLAGEGESGQYGGPPGNLYVVTHVRPHKYFQRRDDDLFLNINVNIAQAALGDQITVPTLDGDYDLHVPAGTQAGNTFRIKGRGVHRIRGSSRGDLIVIANVQVPTKLTGHQKELLAELGETLGREVTTQSGRGLMDRLRDALGV